MDEHLEIRIHGKAGLPTLIYLPGLHGDWTLIASFRNALAGRVRFVEFTYPRTTVWSLDDYAAAVLVKLLESEIRRGWLLGESFGSQIVWALAAKLNAESTPDQLFSPNGIILAGGFVRHPFRPGVKLAQILLEKLPTPLVRTFFAGYAICARLLLHHAPKTLVSLRDFVSRRTPEDIAAMAHRLDLIRSSELRAIASAVSIPVYQLAGGFDPIVPPIRVRRWLTQSCPAYRGQKTIWLADHNVLSIAPTVAANQILQWLRT